MSARARFVAPDARVISAEADQIIGFLVTCDPDERLYLPGVGWLTVMRHPRSKKFIPHFHTDPALRRVLNGLPPLRRLFPSELARYAEALEDPSGKGTIVRFAGSDAIAKAVRRRLHSGQDAEVAELGTFAIVDNREGGDERLVCFEPSEHLSQLLVHERR